MVLPHDKRDAIREAPLLVGPSLIELQRPIQKLGVEADGVEVWRTVCLADELGGGGPVQDAEAIADLREHTFGDPRLSGPRSRVSRARRDVIAVPFVVERLDIRGIHEQPCSAHGFGSEYRFGVPWT